MRLAPRARQAKGKARLGAYEKLLAEANADKDNTRELEIAIPPGPRLGDSVIDVKGLSKAFGDKVLIEDLTFSLPKAGIVGIIGPNGAGKTTLFRMILGQEPPDRGTITHRRHRRARLRRPEPRRPRRRQVGLRRDRPGR